MKTTDPRSTSTRRCAAAVPIAAAEPQLGANVRPCKGAGCACPCARAAAVAGEQASLLLAQLRSSP